MMMISKQLEVTKHYAIEPRLFTNNAQEVD